MRDVSGQIGKFVIYIFNESRAAGTCQKPFFRELSAFRIGYQITAAVQGADASSVKQSDCPPSAGR